MESVNARTVSGAKRAVVILAAVMLFVFIDSVIYGLIFRRTDNAWRSFLAHFLANLLGSVLYFL